MRRATPAGIRFFIAGAPAGGTANVNVNEVRKAADLGDPDAAAQLVIYDKPNDAIFVSEAPVLDETAIGSFVEAFKAGKLRPPRVFDLQWATEAISMSTRVSS